MSASAWRSGVQVTGQVSDCEATRSVSSITCIVLYVLTLRLSIYACTGHAVRTGHRSGPPLIFASAFATRLRERSRGSAKPSRFRSFEDKHGHGIR